MFDPPNIVRAGVALYVLLGGFAAISLWRNAAAPDAIQHSGIIIAALLPALIAILPYLKASELENSFELVLIFDENAKSVIPLGTIETYSHAYMNLYSNLESGDFVSREIKEDEVPKGHALQYHDFFKNEKGFDLIERLVLIAIANKFNGSWDIEHSDAKKTPFGSTVSGKHGESPSSEIKIFDLSKKFIHNKLVSEKWHSIVPPSFHIPENASFSVEADDKERVFLIKDRNSELRISIRQSGSGVLQGLWGKYLPKNTNWASIQYRVRLTAKYKEYSPQGPTYKRWFDNASSAIEVYDWHYIENQREKELLKRHIEAAH